MGKKLVAPPGLLTGQLVKETKISTKELNYYYKFDLLPPPHSKDGYIANEMFGKDSYWDFNCVKRIKTIQYLKKQHKMSIKQIRQKLGTNYDLSVDDVVLPYTIHNGEKYKRKYSYTEEEMNPKRQEYYFRNFDPLLPVNPERSVDCVLHIATHLEDDIRDSDSQGSIEDFIVTRRCIEIISEQTISKDSNFFLDLIISINGDIDKANYIKYFQDIHKKWLSDKVFCKVFQRPNYGYHWAGLHDVWMRYKDTKCKWYVSMECDHRFMYDDWFDKVTEILKSNASIGGFGKAQNNRMIQPKKIMSVDVPITVWRNGDGSIFHNVSKNHLNHTCGALHFCKREVLEKMDKAFGCFTHSMTINHTVDGIIQGEIAFCQKMKALGYRIESEKIPDLVRPLRGAAAYKPEWEKVWEEIETERKK